MVERSASYEQRRPWTLPERLDDLRGPTSGRVTLPHRLDWSEQGTYDLDDPKQLGLMYERVIRESMGPRDLTEYLDADTLVAVWRHIFLPRTVRQLWESRFPAVAPRAADTR
ncbi:hypothetical protein [Virgisporangium aliadipatigenens]|uniref:hypothetical protein n=1 Tax=Virgisporangium aliadipatigenens TaxID=741659 RepID=UPI001EF38F7A|nr:hypothetical protein [Virgisporangium aliadipatigenens]